jgi:phosphoribosylanthranilate isomerase
MSLIVKICGLSTPETLDVAAGCGADMVGFVFFPPSPRHLVSTPRASLENM